MHKNKDGTFDLGKEDDGGVLQNVDIVWRTSFKVAGALIISWGAVKIARRNLAFLLDNMEKKCEKEE